MGLERLRTSLQRQKCQQADHSANAAEGLKRKLSKLDSDIADAKRKLPRIPEDMLDTYIEQIRGWEREQADAQSKLERLASQSPTDDFEELLANVRKLVECMGSADPETVRALWRETIGRVDLRFDEVPKKRYTRYPLASGVVHFLECADSSTSYPGAAR